MTDLLKSQANVANYRRESSLKFMVDGLELRFIELVIFRMSLLYFGKTSSKSTGISIGLEKVPIYREEQCLEEINCEPHLAEKNGIIVGLRSPKI